VAIAAAPKSGKPGHQQVLATKEIWLDPLRTDS
jgi:hypothetical protein